MDLVGTQGRLLMRLLSAASERSKVLSGNIANQNVPGFKRQSYEFESLLVREMGSTNPNFAEVQGQKVTDTESEADANGNNVNMEQERNAMRANLLRFEMYAAISKGRNQLIEAAINGDR
ncbi:MAG: flagellar basal body rod protein FlgB [Planctomycetes bacterium]|nr:flagellar basal body rod protein FlgB [Planctomycetota bacterium]